MLALSLTDKTPNKEIRTRTVVQDAVKRITNLKWNVPTIYDGNTHTRYKLHRIGSYESSGQP